MRIVNLVLAGIFLFGAIVQINDPDPVLWMGIYLAAAAACFLADRKRADIRLPAVVAVVALLWAGWIALEASGWAPFMELFAEWEMRDDVVEETRETYGLLMIAAWMIVLVIRGRRAKDGLTSTTPRAEALRS